MTNRWTSWRRRGGSVAFWAWTVSVTIHIAILTIFGVVEFSQTVRGERQLVPTAKVNRIRELVQTSPLTAKPKVKEPPRQWFAAAASKASLTHQIFDAAKPAPQDLGDWTKTATSANLSSFAGVGILPNRTGFFGSWTDRRKICYLVDCSGSMQGTFSRVRSRLKESIQSLQPDQYFYIIFFGDDKLIESGNGRLLRATQKAKLSAYDFIDSVQPGGQTNAMAALERAVKIRDGSGQDPSIIYFLTDGFELTSEDAQSFLRRTANLLERFAPTAKINTIGFWPQDDDRNMLEIIARQSGGEFVFVGN